MNDIKDILLDAVPSLPAPPDRLTAIRGRAVARRRARVTGTALAALASIAALGTTMAVLTPAGPGTPVGGPAPSSSNATYHWTSPYPLPSQPPKDFPMPGPGACPPTVDFMRMPGLDLYPGSTLPTVSAVTLCRYSQNDPDVTKGQNSLRAGPVAGNVTTFRNIFTRAVAPRSSAPVTPFNPSASGVPDGSGVPSASSSECPAGAGLPPFAVDVVFVHAPDGSSRALVQFRYQCHDYGPDDANDPYQGMRAAVDAEFGTPYE
jgi:hypothetical protein